MCSQQDEFSLFNKQKTRVDTTCVKCKERISIILIGTSGAYCRECFNEYFTHKFRATIGKNPIIRRNSNVALAFSGGNSSAAALDLLIKGLAMETQKKLRYQVGLIYVDESCLYDNPDANAELNQQVENLMKRSGLPYHTVKLEKVFGMAYCAEKQKIELQQESDENMKIMRTNLQQIFKSIKTLTAKQEILTRIRSRLLSLEGKRLGYNYMITGENNSRLAITTLCSVVFGRDGNSLQQDCSFSDGNRCQFAGGIHILRPMKDTAAKEVATYNNLHKVPTVFVPNLSTFKEPRDSIQTLTEKFVVSLAVNFPATEMTISKTSGKLKGNEEMGATPTSICGLCHADVTIATMTRVDEELDDDDDDEDDCVVDDQCCRHFNLAHKSHQLFNEFCIVLPLNCKQLCYSCTSMLSENLLN